MMHRFGWTVFALIVLALQPVSAQNAAPDHAQHATAISVVKDYFQSATARFGSTGEDLSDLVVTDAYVGRRTGATYVYLRQADHGIANAPAQAVVTRTGEVFAPKATFTANLATRVNTDRPSLMQDAAAASAIARLQQLDRPAASIPVLSDAPGEDQTTPTSWPAEAFIPNLDHTRLVYVAQDGGAIRLAWDVTVDTRHGTLWQVKVDAVSGTVLDVTSLTDFDTWQRPASSASTAAVSLAPLAPSTRPLMAMGGSSYNVFAWPAESPSHGSQTVVTDPADPTASSAGWHSTGSTPITTTRGNNVYAYEDRNGDNSPGFSPDGGASLTFNFPFDATKQPEEYQSLALTNLFYWNNIVHDVAYHYGFDEAAGNFQANNFGNGGAGADHVLAEAQDAADGASPSQDNANFSTPADGGSGRMQMYEWGTPPSFTIDAPALIAGAQPVAIGDIGDQHPFSVTDAVVLANDAGGTHFGCAAISNAAAVAGKIALVERGNCNFIDKARNAEAAGAIGVIVHNCSPEASTCSSNNPGNALISMGLPDGGTNDVSIPALFVVQSTGSAMRSNLPGVMVTMVRGPVFRDSDLDSGVIVHEYTHGISNRLTGGPSMTGCLGNSEQMGEGWSDYLGLMLTMKASDTASQRRGIGTYLIFEDTDGDGIRPAPYSTDFAINDFTYGDLGSVSIPHGVGFVWASALWELTWDLIARHGFDADLYDAEGTAGNQIALNLVMEGLRQQPCNPGFVDGRDAILAADTLLYGGAYSNVIWQAFARRGLGANADQGLATSVTDGTEDFTVPPGAVANEAGLEQPERFVLSRAFPNPFRPQSQFSLEVGEAQDVRIEVFDTLGRRVALLHEGPLAPGTRHVFTIDGANLASGVYTYRVTGESFTASEQITVVK